MFKRLAIFCLLVMTFFAAGEAQARTKKKKENKNSSSKYKPSKHARKSRRFRRGNGPDLKSITTESPYKEDPSNGVTPIETKQPGL